MPSTGLLGGVFCRHAPSGVAERLGTPAALELALGGLVAKARAAWPDLEVDDELFVEHLARHLAADGVLEAVHASDLYLAFACLLGDPLALEEFDRAFLRKVPEALGASAPAGANADEMLQTLRQKLLVRRGESAPKIGDYSGRGPLVHWLRAAGVHVIRDFARARNLEVSSPDEALAEMPAPGQGAEMDYLRGHFGPEFKAAFHEALEALSPRDRNLLRLSYLDAINPDEIGRIYRVHRTTVWRWLTQCREELFNTTRQLLAARVPMSDAEFESLMNVVKSQLDVSIGRVLRKE